MADNIRILQQQIDFTTDLEQRIEDFLVIGSQETRTALNQSIESAIDEIERCEGRFMAQDANTLEPLDNHMALLQGTVHCLISAKENPASPYDVNRQTVAAFKLTDRLRTLHRDIQEEQFAELHAVIEQHNRIIAFLIKCCYSAAALVVALGILLAWALSRIITSGLMQLQQYAQEISSGDVQIELQNRSADEFGKVVTSLDRLNHEITERKCAERKLTETVSLLTATLESTADGILVTDTSGNAHNYNEKFSAMWRLSDDILAAFKHSSILACLAKQLKDPAALHERLILFKQDPQAEDITSLTCTDGRMFELYLRPQIAGHDVVGLVWSFHDITARCQAEEEKKQLQSQVRQKQKLEAIGTLAGGIAHDFNNILMAIIGYTDLASLALQEDGDIQSAESNLEQVLVGGRRAKDLVKQILAFSRNAEQKLQPTDITPVLKEALKMLRSSIKTTIDIQSHFDDGIKSILADSTQIHQVVVNLCTNAAHAMDKAGGILEVTLQDVKMHEPLATRFKTLEPGSYVKLAVKDNGNGMGKSTLDRIFEPFFTTKDVNEGTGMGLSVVLGIVEQCGGTIAVESCPGMGSTFSLFFPHVEMPETAPMREEDIPAGHDEVIFLVDDEETLVAMMSKTLTRLGYTVISETSSEAAWKTFVDNPHRFDLVITDYAMPVMTGRQLARKIHKIRPDLPIVMCTGSIEHINIEKAQAAGISELLLKPVNRYEIARALHVHLAKKEIAV
ncbi:ATP-binding protein [Planctomycetota bacterium]